MPERNGYDTTADIRELEKKGNVRVPIIAMTANAMVGDKEKCLQAGMDEYISKPINIGELKDVLGQWIDFEENDYRRAIDSRSEEIPSVDLSILYASIGDDPHSTRKFMKTFIAQSQNNIQTLHDCISSGMNGKIWTDTTQMMKGGSLSIGAQRLGELCNEAQMYQGGIEGRQNLLRKIGDELARVKNFLIDNKLFVSDEIIPSSPP